MVFLEFVGLLVNFRLAAVVFLKACAAGKESAVDRTSCQNCSAGYHNPNIGPCQAGAAGKEASADRTMGRLCSAGYYYNPSAGRSCQQCPSCDSSNIDFTACSSSSAGAWEARLGDSGGRRDCRVVEKVEGAQERSQRMGPSCALFQPENVPSQ